MRDSLEATNMNTRGLLDQLLKSGQDMLQKQGGQASARGSAPAGLGGLLGSGGGLGTLTRKLSRARLSSRIEMPIDLCS